MPITQSDYLAMKARISRQNAQQRAIEGEAVESDLHAQIIAHCKRQSPQWVALHGSMAHRTHRTEGEPDFVILRDSGKVLLIECKSRTGKLSTAQMGMQMMCRDLGHTVHVVRSFEEFWRAIKQ